MGTDFVKLFMDHWQIRTMESIYSRELDMIEKALKMDRDVLVSGFQKNWDALYKQLEEEDALGDKKRREIMKNYEDEMEKVMIEHDEEYRRQKIELERECQEMQQQVERTKALCQLNSEKLAYNYNVLKSREKENAIIKNQQKRKIRKLQAFLDSLKKNYSDLQINTRMEIEKLTRQTLKTHKSIKELEEKSIHFTRINEKRYLDIWEMNTERANELIEKILTADKLIHERVLGVVWEPPKQKLPTKEDLPSYCAAIKAIQQSIDEYNE